MGLKKVTVYLTEEEYGGLEELAQDEEVTLGAVIRAKLGFPYRRRGAPRGNTNRRMRGQSSQEMKREK